MALRTLGIRHRLVAAIVVLLALVLVATGFLVSSLLRDRLVGNIDDQLDERVAAVGRSLSRPRSPLLGVGRALAETAALIFTSGYVDRAPSSLFDSGRALSLHIYDLAMNVAGAEANAYASALVLLQNADVRKVGLMSQSGPQAQGAN